MARETGHSRRNTDPLTQEAVAAYLRDHPDFLVQNPDLMPVLTPPALARGRGVVDFQAFMVERLRSELARAGDQQRSLIATSRANLAHQTRIHAAILLLLDAGSFEHLIETITTELAVRLGLDVACLVVESNGAEMPHVHRSGVRVVEPGTVGRRLGRHAVRLRGDTEGDAAIFGAAAGLVRSEALVRIQVSSETPVGLIAFGSREPDMFHPGQGTELVVFLSKVIERCIRAWLDLPA
jgi:uncharacterized protein YigA (DUF484 family)